MPDHQRPTVCVDIAVIGGGVAGLWLLNRLCRSGYNAVLLEHKALGSEQTMASQGMIHGGIKYTLGGALSGASQAVADMPEHWRNCLAGQGDVDLRAARVLSDHFYLWSSASVTSRMATFLGSKATRGRVERVAAAERPALFQEARFKGDLYKLVDIVLDVPSVVRALADNYRERIFLLDWQQATWAQLANGHTALNLNDRARPCQLQAGAFVLCAGQGNAGLLADLGAAQPRMQRRPLQQVMVRHQHPHSFYGHCLGVESVPRLTISSHPGGDGSQVWYLGGSLAERGAQQNASELIAHAQRELTELMPWVDLGNAQWATLKVDRAEPLQHNFARPDQAFARWARDCANVIAAWPTKMTLAPNLAAQVLTLLADKDCTASGLASVDLPLAAPPVATTPWQQAFGGPR